jgi:hypothetical protein
MMARSQKFNYDVAAIVHPMSDVLARVGIYRDADTHEAFEHLREYVEGENDPAERAAMHKVLDALEELAKLAE